MSDNATLILQRRGFCPCGFPVLKDGIEVGTVYEVDILSKRGLYSYMCGGCQRWFNNVECIKAKNVAFPENPMSPLPFVLFQDLEQPTQ